MTDAQATFFATLIDEWVRAGIRHAVVCPGNRSSLFSALLVEDGRLEVHVGTDERSASFLALGIGKATGTPAVFWCTSGTAAVEAHAAVVEAHHALVPLIVCTADRPVEARHVRDWQSIDQSTLYDTAPRWSFDPGIANEATRPQWRSIAARSVLSATSHPLGPGPVHLNLAIREPWTLAVGELPPGRPDAQPWHRRIDLDEQPSSELNSPSRRGLIVVGESDVDSALVHEAAARLGWPVLAEARSGCRTQAPTAIAHYDALARIEAFTRTHTPDVVLHFGAASLSKPLATWLAAPSIEHVVVDPFEQWAGPRLTAATIVAASPNTVCRALLKNVEDRDESWLADWRAVDDRVAAVVHDASQELTEASVATAVAEQPLVFAATSMPVRDIEAFATRQDDRVVLANRGASGMDGIVATALGVALGRNEPVTLLIGDLTFLYDLNALWSLELALSVSLTIVVVDNRGGGIFSTLPSLRSLEPATFERVVATPRAVDIAAVGSAFGVPVAEITAMDQLRAELARATEGVRIALVRIDRVETVTHRQALTDRITRAVSST